MSAEKPCLVRKDWSDVLARAEETITAALDALGRHGAALEQLIHSCRTEDRPPLTWPQGLDEAFGRMQHLQSMADGAAAAVAEADGALAAGEEQLRQWLADAGAARAGLARWLRDAHGPR